MAESGRADEGVGGAVKEVKVRASLSLNFVIVKTDQDIQSKLTILKHRLKERYPIVSMALFGSYARNQQTKSSDLDVLVEFNGKMGSNFIDMALEMEQFLGIKVDLVSRRAIKEKYFKAIESDLIYV